MKVIFLDIDGVLNSSAYFKTKEHQLKKSDKEFDDIDESKVVLLKQIIDATDARIVLSSTWRELDDESYIECYKMYKYLIDTLGKYDIKIFDKTPTIRQDRPLEIQTWINDEPSLDEVIFISLDDDFSKKDYDKYGIGDNLVHTIFFTDDLSVGGLQEYHVEQAIKILNNDD